MIGPATNAGTLGYNAIFYGFGARVYFTRCNANHKPNAKTVRVGRG